LDVDTTIIGAGPYGLSIAAHLQARQIPYEIFGTPLESWRTFMPDGMLLKSERFASNLWDPKRQYTLQRYCEANRLPYQRVGDPVSRAQFLDYAEWFRTQAVGDPREVKIAALQRTPGGFALQLTDGSRLTSRRVILATGHMAFRIVPPELGALPEPLVMHSARIGDVQQYAGRDVCIIGAGQSALESAAILHENGARVRLLVRRAQLLWNGRSMPRPLLARILEPDAGVASGWKSFAISELPRVFRWRFSPERRHRFVTGSYGPSGSWWLRERITSRVDVQLNTHVLSATAESPATRGVVLRVAGSNGESEMRTDHLIAATGFKVDIEQLDYLDRSLVGSIVREAQGIPSLSSSFETSVPGLFVVGLASAPVFGPIMRFMYGAKHVAPILAARLR
jgi:FAD-dependent urate hydroxylase